MTDLNLKEIEDSARLVVLEEGVLSVSLLQLRFSLPHSAALRLAHKLRGTGMEDDLKHPQPDGSIHPVTRFLAKVLELAWFFRDLHEDREGGDPRAIQLLRPWGATPTQFKELISWGMYRDQSLTLTKAAVATLAACPEEFLPTPHVAALRDQLVTMCAPEERPFFTVTTRQQIYERSVTRFARYVRLVAADIAQRDTRAVDHFVQRAWIPTGRAHIPAGAERWFEHVVPCVFIFAECERRFRADPGLDISVMSAWLKRYLVAVEIPKVVADQLDGPMGLKMVMPEGWNWEGGCVFERLHKANLSFDLPPGSMCCTKTAASDGGIQH